MVPKVITAPTAEPISLEQARQQLRLDPYGSPPEHEDDDLVMRKLKAAREWAEGYTGRAIAEQVREFALDAFPCGTEAIELPHRDVRIVSVRYLDSDQVEQTIATNLYSVDDYQTPAWLMPAAGTEWPVAGEFVNAVKVRYEDGYTAAGESPQTYPLPEQLRDGLLLLLGHLYENREATSDLKLEELPIGIVDMFRRFRVLKWGG